MEVGIEPTRVGSVGRRERKYRAGSTFSLTPAKPSKPPGSRSRRCRRRTWRSCAEPGRRWLRGDVHALVSLWDPEESFFDLQHFQNWPETSYHGVEGVRWFLDGMARDVGGILRSTSTKTFAPDGRVVSLFTQRGKGGQSGFPMALPMAHIATLRNGRIIRFDNYDDRAKALEAAGLSE